MLRMAKRKAGYKPKIKRVSGGGPPAAGPGLAVALGEALKPENAPTGGNAELQRNATAALQASISATSAQEQGTAAKIEASTNKSAAESHIAVESAQKLNLRIDSIQKFFGGMFGWMFKSEFPLAHYITLFIVILILFGAFSIGMGGKIPNLQIVSTTNSIVNAIKRFLSKYFGWLIPSTYRLSLLSNLFTPFGSDKLEGIPRTTINGRCDNVLLKTDGNSCRNVSTPTNIQWVINPDNIPEMNELPQSILDRFKNNLVVSIPYETTGLYYTPNCDKMKFADGTPAAIFNQRSLADTVCRFTEKASTVYKTKMTRQTDQSDPYKLCTA